LPPNAFLSELIADGNCLGVFIRFPSYLELFILVVETIAPKLVKLSSIGNFLSVPAVY